MGTRRRILIVEDEPDLAHLVAFHVERAGYQPSAVADGLEALRVIQAGPPDLVILDLMIPGMGGLDVARRLRLDPKTARIPILMLTARAEERDQLTGLAAGADDYITKPFSMKVLLARIEAILRRSAPEGAGDSIAFGPIEANLNLHEAAVYQRPVTLTVTEFRILIALMRSAGKAVSREDLVYAAIGPGITVTARTIDVHIASVRRKLGAAGSLIRTIRGVGYLLADSAPAGSAGGEGAGEVRP